MIRKRPIILFWTLLLVPTVIITGVAFRLLSHEQERVSKSVLSSLDDRASAISNTVSITVEGVEDAITDSLLEIPNDQLQETLLAWEESNPLVRNVFIWDADKGLIYPVQGMESTSEERRFISRYDALFSGRVPWDWTNDNSREEENTSREPESSPLFSKSSDDSTELKSEHRRLLDLAKPKNLPAVSQEVRSPESEIRATIIPLSGWIPWFSDNRLCLLGWVKPSGNGPVYGIELETMTLLSRLVTEFPDPVEAGVVYALVDGNGLLLHQSGRTPVNIAAQPDISLPLSTLLPHWRIFVYLDETALSGDQGFLVVTSILLAIFIIAILSGGVLLTWQAVINMRDAVQKTSFVSSVSHELKTPLTSIRMYAELLKSGRIKNPEKTSHYLSVIVTESQRLTRLVNNVLDFGRLEEGKKNYSDDRFDLSLLVRNIMDTHELRIREAGLDSVIHLPESEMPVHSDRDAIEQVILNLLDNAVKYASGGKTVTLTLNTSDEADGYYDLTVCDMGPGIPDSHKELIFQKFHRVDNSLTSRQPGSGLGLTIARRILRDLGGDLIYRPDSTGGCCFISRIPKP